MAGMEKRVTFITASFGRGTDFLLRNTQINDLGDFM